MSSSFTFKQFVIHQENTAMKAGTDGVLLGAWCDFANAQRILDIGTGTGLIALMAAQKSDENARIHALEIDSDAYRQACGNVAESRFKGKIEVFHGDFAEFSLSSTPQKTKYDYIVSNPPFFENSQKSTDSKRTLARHTDSLPFSKLIDGVAEIISDGGFFSVIIPNISCLEFVRLCALSHLHLCHKTLIFTKQGADQPRRVMLTFSKQLLPLIQDSIAINAIDGGLTKQYKDLTCDFYLKF
ncbi:MAG: methyltransferase [Bacteroidales bacterium]|nr:methyltransferase [Bacteroidales bacterium]